VATSEVPGASTGAAPAGTVTSVFSVGRASSSAHAEPTRPSTSIETTANARRRVAGRSRKGEDERVFEIEELFDCHWLELPAPKAAAE
jgi:hypothetical protein